MNSGVPSSGVKLQKGGANYLLPLSTEANNVCNYTSTSLISLSDVMLHETQVQPYLYLTINNMATVRNFEIIPDKQKVGSVYTKLFTQGSVIYTATGPEPRNNKA